MAASEVLDDDDDSTMMVTMLVVVWQNEEAWGRCGEGGKLEKIWQIPWTRIEDLAALVSSRGFESDHVQIAIWHDEISIHGISF